MPCTLYDKIKSNNILHWGVDESAAIPRSTRVDVIYLSKPGEDDGGLCAGTSSFRTHLEDTVDGRQLI